MQYRRLGRTDREASVVGLGCWPLGGALGPVSDADAVATVHAALDAGVTLFDTADAYGPRHSEELLGRALDCVRAEVLIVTKVGEIGAHTGHRLTYTTPEHVYACCDASLHRLRTDCIDVYLCHQSNPDHPDVFLEAFERLRDAGKIRAYGVSTDDPAVVTAFDAHGHCAVCQIGYSVLNRRAEANILPLCQEHDIGTMIRIPLERGVLSGRYDRSASFEDINRSAWNEGEPREQFQRQVAAAERLRPLTDGTRSLAQVALAYLLAHPAVTAVIPGATRPAQVRENAGASALTLTPDDLATIRSIPETAAPPVGSALRQQRLASVRR